MIEGEAGIGKTTLWLEAVRTAEARGYRVLSARPAESEAKLSYTALTDLVGDAFEETRAALPAPQQRALETALLRVEANEPADPRTTATAFVGVLAALAAEQPVLLAVDDVQWLDAASKRALEFGVRRLPASVGLLVTRREEGDGEAPLGLGRAVPEDRLQRLVPGPLSLAALSQLISSRLGVSISRPILVRVAEASGGNPLFALEIGQAAMRAASEFLLDDPLPVPPRLKKLVAARIRALSPCAQEVLLVAASLSRPTASTIARALAANPDPDPLSALAEAEDAGILVAEGDRIRFAHPLLASAVYGSASRVRRRQLHRRLAEVVSDPEERAHHLACSVLEGDEATAGDIEQGARRAAMRGAQHAAAELFQASCRLTPADRSDGLARRLLGKATALWRLGDVASARGAAEDVLAASSVPGVQAEALSVLAGVEWDAGAMRKATERLEQALAAASGNRELEGPILTKLALMNVPLHPSRAVEHADAAKRLLTPERHAGLLGSILIDRFFAEALLGRGARRELLERGLELEAADRPHPVPLIWFAAVDDCDAARERYAMEDGWYRDHGEERLRANRLGYLALVELRGGRWDRAEQYAETSCETSDQRDASGPSVMPFGVRSLVDAHRGRIKRARATLRPLIEETERTEKAWWAANLLSVLGFAEFAASEHEAADRELTRMRMWLASIGVEDPLFDRSEPFHVESLVAVGELDRARATLQRLEERGRALPRQWITTALPRARALVLAADGDVAAALEALEELDFTAASQLPFELASALLLEGRLHRRANHKLAAADALRQALEIFERLGAPVWAEQARSEFERVGLRHRAPDELTATELRVAGLAAAGLTNREVASAAFMSPKTVEANLARVYRKLGIRSRAELGARMRDLDAQM